MPSRLRRRLAAQAGLILWLAAAGAVQAETAQMLPAGIAKARYQYTVGHAEDGFDADGNRKSLDDLFRDGLEASGLPTTVPSVYRIDTASEVDFTRHDLYLEYGVSPDFGLGLWTYYIDQRVTYSASLQREAGWVLLNPATQTAVTVGTETADSADQSAAALGDTVLGIKHRLIGDNDTAVRFAYHLGLRLPTGHVADPTEPGDLSTGDGQTDIGLWFNFDWEPADRWCINLHSRHEYQLAGERDVPDPANPGGKLSQEFQPGFYHYLEVSGTHRIPRPSFNAELELLAIYEDEGRERRQAYDVASGSYRGGLDPVDDSDSSLLRLEPRMALDFFPSKVPLAAKLYYGIPVQGRNALAVEYVGIRFDAYW